MKIFKETDTAKVTVPKSLLSLSRLYSAERLELHELESAAVLLKDRMTAMEVINAVSSLDRLASQLLEALAGACEQCVACEEGCPFMGESRKIRLPAHVLGEANIPKGAKLCAVPDPETGCVIVTEREAGFDLDNVPDELLDALLECGVCLESLSGLLASGEAVYGS